MKGGTRTYFLLIAFNILLLLTDSMFFYSLSSGLSSIFLAFSHVSEKLSDFQENMIYRLRAINDSYSLGKENRKLKRELLLLRLENLKLKEELERTRIFNKLVSGRWKFLIARVTNLNPENMRIKFVIDLGRRDGIKEYMPVVDLDGNIVGKIVQPIRYTNSTVEPITNPSSSIGARIKEGVGVLRGTGKKLTFLDYIYITRYPEKGELVRTSGFDGIFPEGLPIGKIIRVKKGKYIFLRVEVKPNFSYEKIRYVGVILRW